MTSTTLSELASPRAAADRRPATFPAMLESYKGEIARALPRHLNPDSMLRIALTCFRMTPKLAECAPASVFACVIQASQLGLRPGVMGECYLIPYKNQCTLQLGYQGLLELVRRSGLVQSVSALVVHQRDEFDVQWGTTPGIVHRPYLDGDAGPARLVYAVAHLKGGGTHAELMTLADIERIRARSQNVQNAVRYGKETPWDTDWEEMARKTVLRRICKYLPKSPELLTGLALDDAAHRGAQNLSVQDAIGNAFSGLPLDDEPTGEVPPPPPPAEEPPPPPPAEAPGADDPAPAQQQRAKRTRPSPPPEQSDEAAAPPPATPTYAQFADWVNKASNGDSAAVIVDQARSVLSEQQVEELGAVYRRRWQA